MGLFNSLMERAQDKGGRLLFVLGIISILGLLYPILNFLWGINLTLWTEITIFIGVGVGLLVESDIIKNRTAPKIFTFFFGLLYLVMGIIQLPFIGLNIEAISLGFVVVNLIVFSVVIYELFWVK